MGMITKPQLSVINQLANHETLGLSRNENKKLTNCGKATLSENDTSDSAVTGEGERG